MPVPTLRPGDVVIMDNLSGHKRPSVQEIIEAAGARLMFLPPCSPGFNPIEMAFARLKALLRKAAVRTVAGLWAPSASSSTASRRKNAKITSPPADTMQIDRKTL